MMRLATKWSRWALAVAVVATVAYAGTAVAQPLVTGNLTVYYDFESLEPSAGGINEVGVLLDGSGNGFNASVFAGEVGFDEDPGTFAIESDSARGTGAGRLTQSNAEFWKDDLPVYGRIPGKLITDDFFDKTAASTDAVTYAAWIKTTRNESGDLGEGDQSIFQGRSGDGGHGNPHFQLQGDGKFRMTFRNQPGDTIVDAPKVYTDGTEDSGLSYPIDEWFHYAGTYDKATNTWNQYYNGVLLQTGSAKEGTDGNLGDWGGQEEENFDYFALGFGAVYDSGERRFDGLLDELYIFNRALTGEEIATLAMVGSGEPSIADWQANFPIASGATLGEGDKDGDGDVDGNDFLLIQAGSSSSVSAVPEPGTAVLLVLAGLALAGQRKRRV